LTLWLPSASSSREVSAVFTRQVFWLSDHPVIRPFPFVIHKQWHFADFVPDYSGGTAPEFHGIPYYSPWRAPCWRINNPIYAQCQHIAFRENTFGCIMGRGYEKRSAKAVLSQKNAKAQLLHSFSSLWENFFFSFYLYDKYLEL